LLAEDSGWMNSGQILLAGSDTFANVLGKRAGHNTVIAQLTNFLARFMAHDVSAKRASVDGFPRCGDLEPFFHPFMGFLLRHDLKPDLRYVDPAGGVSLRNDIKN